jgi:hypothetical protein
LFKPLSLTFWQANSQGLILQDFYSKEEVREGRGIWLNPISKFVLLPFFHCEKERFYINRPKHCIVSTYKFEGGYKNSLHNLSISP